MKITIECLTENLEDFTALQAFLVAYQPKAFNFTLSTAELIPGPSDEPVSETPAAPPLPLPAAAARRGRPRMVKAEAAATPAAATPAAATPALSPDWPFDPPAGSTEEKAYTLSEVRQFLVNGGNKGHTKALRDLLNTFGVSQISQLPAEKYNELMSKAADIIDAKP